MESLEDFGNEFDKKLDAYFDELFSIYSKEEIDTLAAEITSMHFPGPTPEEYFMFLHEILPLYGYASRSEISRQKTDNIQYEIPVYADTITRQIESLGKYPETEYEVAMTGEFCEELYDEVIG